MRPAQYKALLNDLHCSLLFCSLLGILGLFCRRAISNALKVRVEGSDTSDRAGAPSPPWHLSLAIWKTGWVSGLSGQHLSQAAGLVPAWWEGTVTLSLLMHQRHWKNENANIISMSGGIRTVFSEVHPAWSRQGLFFRSPRPNLPSSPHPPQAKLAGGEKNICPKSKSEPWPLSCLYL